MYSFEKLEPRILLSADLLPLAPEVQTDGGADNSAIQVSIAEEAQLPQLSEETSSSPPDAPPIIEDTSETVTPGADATDENSPQVEAVNTEEETEEVEEGGLTNEVLEPSTPATAADDQAAEDEPAASTVEGSENTEQDSPSELIFINNDIEASDPLIADALAQNDRTEVIVLDGGSDGIQQITDNLAEYDSVDALHFLSHGTSGNVKLGNSWLNSDNIGSYEESISSWGESLSGDGDILFYGCDLTSDQDGIDLVKDISDLTGADVAASDDTTGHQLLGGDWVLEYQTGEIEAELPISNELQDDWVHVLAEESIADDFNTGLYNNSTGTVGWKTNWVEIGEATDPTQGEVYIDNNRLYMVTADGGEVQRGLTRTVDLSSAASASISFDYEVDPNEYKGHVALQIRTEDDPPGQWQNLANYWTNWAYTKTESIDISPYISGATEIRFESGTGTDGFSYGSDDFYIDNLQIDYTTDTWSTPLWLTTSGDVTNGGQLGTETWKDSDIIGVGNPNLNFNSGNTSGTFSVAAQLSAFADKDTDIDALHYVSRDLQIGSSDFQLLQGDVLFVAHGAEPSDFQGLDPEKEDIVLFRPTTEGDYSTGNFQMLIEDLTGGHELRGITLIEQDVNVGGRNLDAGDLLFVRSGGAEDQSVWLYETGDVGSGSGPSGDITELLDGHDPGVDIREQLLGIDLVEEAITVGGKTLNSGTILLSVDKSDRIGSLDVQQFDIFALDVTSLSIPPGSGMATASLFFDGSDVSFNDDATEKLDGFTLTVSPEQTPNSISGGTFDASANTLTLTGTDFSFIGSIGSEVQANMDWSKFVWDINGDNTTTTDITFSSSDFSSVILTDETTLTLNLTSAKSDAIVATAGYGVAGGIDTIDIDTGFSGNGSGDYSTSDGLVDGPLTTITAPSDITISSSSIDEDIDTSAGATVGTLGAVDADSGDTAAYTIVGGADAALFTIGGAGGDELILSDGIIDYERQDSYSIGIRVTDSKGLFHHETLTITVNDINENPIIVNNSLTLEEGEAVVFSSTDLSATDPENSDNSLLFTVSSISGGQFEQVSAPGVAITTFLQSDIVSGNIRFVHDGGEAAPDYTVNVTDGSATVSSGASITFNPKNDLPVFTDNMLTISEGGTVLLGSPDIKVDDPDNLDSELTFTASNVVGGQFELTASPGTAIFTFTQTQINDNDVQFVHDGGETVPGYNLTVSDGSDMAGPDSAIINYTAVNDAPQIQNNSLTLVQGETITINNNHLLALDPDDSAVDLLFTILNVTGGRFELVGIPGEVTGFSQLQVNNGDIQFVHDGSANAPSYDVRLDDKSGLIDGPEAATINFDTVNQTPVLVNNSLTITEGGSVTLTGADLSATDQFNTDESTLIFSVAGVTGGQFELVSNPSVAISSFNQAAISGGQVRFVHDGGEAAPAYNVTVTDGALSVGPAPVNIIAFTNVNDAPLLGNNGITIDEGGTVVLDGADISASDVDTADGDLVFTVSNVTGGMFTTTAAPTVAISSFTQDQVTTSQIQFVHNGDEAAPAYRVTVSDSSLSDGPEIANVIFTPQNDAPTLGNNSLSIDEGGTVVLSTADLSATDSDTIDGDLIFNITAVSGGQFERLWTAGTPITSFTQSEIISGEIQFIDNGDESAPAYTVTVSDSSLTSGSAPAAINFTLQNDAPTLVNNSLTISEGETVTLSGTDLSATDVDSSDPALTFIVSEITGGQFELVSAPSIVVTSFTQADITSGQVRFIHDGNEAAPAYNVMTFDGSLISSQQPASISYTSLNDAPTATNLSLADSYTEDTPKPLAPIVISDVDGGTTYSVTFTLSDTAAGSFNTDSHGTASSTFSSGVLTLSGSDIDDVNTLLSSIVFTPAPDYNSDFNIATSVTDGLSTPLTGNRSMNSVSVNDAPTATNTTHLGTYVEDTTLNLQDIVISDIDVGEIVTTTLSLANPAYGSISTSGGATYDGVTGVWQITGTVADVNTALSSVSYVPNANIAQDTYIDVVIQDGLEDGVGILTGRIDLSASPVGDTPLVENISTLPSTQSGLIYITPNVLDGPEITHFQIVNISGGTLYQQDGFTQIFNGDFITAGQGTAGVRFSPLSTNDGSFGVLSSENGVTAASQSSIAVSTISVAVPASPPVSPEISLPELSEATEQGEPLTTLEESFTESSDSATDTISTPAATAQNPIAEIAAGQLPTRETAPEIEKGDSSTENEPPPEESSNEEPEAVLTVAAEYIQERSQPGSFGAAVDPNSQEPFVIDLSFRDLSASGFAAGFDQNDRTGLSLSTTGENESSLFSAEDYDLLNLDYRQRTVLEYENLKNSLDSFREETKNEALLGRTAVGSAIAASTGLSAGYVVWMLRSGALLSSILSSLPAWQLADPLAILVGHRNEEEEDEDESIESILTETQDKTKIPEKDEKQKI